MGSVFGKESVKEPPFDVLLERQGKDVATTYQLRRYQKRYAASVSYDASGDNSGFRTLARYIGVFGTPENEGATGIAMTAPVVMEKEAAAGGPESIAMTAPVVMEQSGEGGGANKKMMFMLPAEYDDMLKIPKPTNPAVSIEEIPPEVGVVHRYNGSFKDEINRRVATRLGEQLAQDGVAGMTAQYAAEHFQFWGYNPPFTLPVFRRNEVWLKLNDEQLAFLRDNFSPVEEVGLAGSPSTMRGRSMFSLSACGFVVGVVAVNYLFRTRSEYRRL